MAREMIRIDRCRRCGHPEAQHDPSIEYCCDTHSPCAECRAESLIEYQCDDHYHEVHYHPGEVCSGWKPTYIEREESPAMAAWDAAFAGRVIQPPRRRTLPFGMRTMTRIRSAAR